MLNPKVLFPGIELRLLEDQELEIDMEGDCIVLDNNRFTLS